MITTVTLNASIDKAYHMRAGIEGGTVMRVARCANTAGGKGLNVARVARLLGADVLATGLAGGFNGSYLEALLDADGIPHEFYRIAGETRSCINVLDPRFGSSELLEPGPEVAEAELEKFLSLLSRLAAASDVVVMSGSLPAGLPSGTYARMVEICAEAGAPTILDTSGEALWEGMAAGPALVKPNREELGALYQTDLETRDDVVDLARRVRARGVGSVAVSLGGDGALLVCDGGTFLARPPKVDAVNTVGCGDSMVAAFAVAMEREMAAGEALAFAVAAGTANALSPGTGSFEPAAFEEILPQVELREL